MTQEFVTDTALLAADDAAREAALDVRRSFIIDAPAGAGKTELLTQRFLNLLTKVDEPEEIVALTFTNKAAAEMQDRIFRSLVDATRPPEPQALPHKRRTRELACAVLARNAERQWQLLHQPARLRVMTLDALSARIVRQMPLLSRFGTQPAITTDATRYYEQAAQNTLDLLEADTAASGSVEQALAYFDNDTGRLRKMLVSMLGRRDQWLAYALGTDAANLEQDVTLALQELVRNRLSEICDRISPARQQTFMAAARHAAAQSPDSPIHQLADWHNPLSADPADLPRWRALADLFLTGKDELRKVFQKPINLTGAANQAQKQRLLDTLADLTATGDGTTLAGIRQLPDPQLDRATAELIQHLALILQLASAQLWMIYTHEKVVDFSEIAARALQALSDDTADSPIREHLDYRLRHLLIDEFQDTSPLQVELLKRLTTGWENDPERSVFLVGDPMQSIYRFRKADVGLFLRVRQRGLGRLQPESLRLYRNNRSYPAIIDWVNQTFEGVFSPVDDIIRGAVTYAPSVPGKPGTPNAGVQIHPIIHGDAEADPSDQAPRTLADAHEADLMLNLIRTARAENPEGEIAVLVRARSHLEPLIARLQSCEPRIPFQAVEIEGLAARQPVQDLVSLTRALHHAADRVHWLALLRAPWCGMTLADLHGLAADDHQQTLWSLMQDDARIQRLSPDGQQRLLRCRQILAEATSHRGLQRPRRWIEGVWQALRGPACLSEASDISDCQAYFRLLDSLEQRGALDLTRLDEGLARLYAAPDSAPASHHVQLMTIHKSKGLEFDTVILPGLHRTPPPDEKAMLLWDDLLLDDGAEHLVVAPAPAAGSKDSDVPTPYDLLRHLEKTRGQNEDRRVLYVAVTRAIRRLHLLGIASRDLKSDIPGALKPPAPSALLAALWPAAGPAFMQAAVEPAHPIPPAASIDGRQFIPKLIRLRAPQGLPDEGHTPVMDTGTPEPLSELFSPTLDMDIGTLIHRYLEAIARDGLDAWHPERISALQPVFVRHLQATGHPTADAVTAAQIVHDTLQRALTDTIGRWILGPREAAGCEVPLSSLDTDPPTDDPGTPVRRHVIDRTFIDAGTRWIIDYKTLRLADTDAASCEALLKGKAESYRPQLARYATLYAHEAAQGLSIRTAIFFPAHGKLIEL